MTKVIIQYDPEHPNVVLVNGINYVPQKLHEAHSSIATAEVIMPEVKGTPYPKKSRKGDRVRNIQKNDVHVKFGATGTVLQDDQYRPLVQWDSPEMLTERGQSDAERQWYHRYSSLELLPSEPEKPDYSGLIGKWVRYCLRGCETAAIFGKWAKITKIERDHHTKIWIDVTSPFEYAGAYWNTGEDTCFDLTDPRDENPDEAERAIAFDYERWKRGDFLRVVDGSGQEVTKLTDFATSEYPLVGCVGEDIKSWEQDGTYFVNTDSDQSLRLVVKGGAE